MIDKFTDNDLDWLAFRYVAGEMTTDETAEFELILSDDQGARDAVVRAVELSQAIVATGTSSRPQSIGMLTAVSQGWMQQVTWISTSVAAALLIALALNFGNQPTPRGSESDDLARAWLRNVEPEAGEPGTSASGVDDAEFVTTDAPAWMVEAVRSLHGDASPEDDDPNSTDEMES